MTCNVPDCLRAAVVRGWCSKHYERWRRHGDPLIRLTPETRSPCSVDGCDNLSKAHGWCYTHLARWKRNGDPLVANFKAADGEPMRLVQMAASYAGPDCVIWPFAKDPQGRGKLMIDGRLCLASRVVCEKVHGPAPSPIHHAAHSCGKGHEGCFSGRHLRWATPAENEADKLIHGTRARGERSPSVKLTEAEAREIIALRGQRPVTQIAIEFGIAKSHVWRIQNGRRWGWLEIAS